MNDSRLGSIGVFVVDDHGMVRDSIRMACDARPRLTVVGEAGEGLDALEAIPQTGPDVVVLDVVLPDIDGFEVARRLRDGGFAGSILILTGREDPNDHFEALLLGVDGFVQKNVGLEQVADAIEAVAAGEKVFDQQQLKAVSARIGQLAKEARASAQMARLLTSREREILNLLVKGLTTRQIATNTDISERTAETHIANLYRKLDVRTRVQAVYRAASLGLVELAEHGQHASRTIRGGSPSS